MSTPTPVDVLTEQLHLGVSLLEELHVLSQTQTLLLESANLSDLKTLVEAKKGVVDRIIQTEMRVASLRDAADPERDLRERSALKERAVDLIERISSVERKNQYHLEALRADVIRRSRALQESRKLQAAYGPL